jgi:TonB family protein
MILTWMLGTVVFGLLATVAAHAAERAMVAVGRARRMAWGVALAVLTAWPIVAGTVYVLRSRTEAVQTAAVTITASAVRSAATQMPAIGAATLARAERFALAGWVVLSVALLARLGVGILRMRRMARGGTPTEIDGHRVLLTESVGPAVFGVFAPTIVVPRWLLDLDAPLRALVLRHEEQHRQRGDSALILGGAIATALMPWNAGAWICARRLRLALELDCDARVVDGNTDAARYGRLLLLVAQRQSGAQLAPMLAESNAHLGRRIAAMRDAVTRRKYVQAGVFGALAVGVVIVACSGPVMNDVTAPKPISANALAKQPGNDVYFEFQVAQPVREAQMSARPRYPDILKTAGVEGEVLAQFVVNEDGTPMEGSLKILKSSHPLFTASVQSAYGGMRFEPARADGRAVRQLVQMPFVFAIATGDVAERRTGVQFEERARQPAFKVKPTDGPARLPETVITATKPPR